MGLPAILDPSRQSPFSPGFSIHSSQDDSDIKALLQALPTKSDIEAMVLPLEEQLCRDYQQICSNVHLLDGRLSKGESAVSALELRITQLEQGHSAHQDQLVEEQRHTEDLKNRSRWNNLHLLRLPEANGTENLVDTVTAILHKVLDSSPPVNLEFDRVHRVLGPKPKDSDRPQDVICCLHRYTQKEMVLSNAWPN